jgi:hypothetical protein
MKDIEDTEGLTNQELHAALANGDARDRVLAIWALALRSSALSFNSQLRNEPDPGVRRALAVVLASHGEIDLLVAMCRHDPSVHVRASTAQILVRFAAAGRVPWDLVSERLADAPEVRAAVISQLDDPMPVEMAFVLLEALRDPHQEVRHEAFETLARLEPGVPELSEMVVNAAPDERAHLLQIWFRVESPDVLCTILAALPVDVRVQALLMMPALAATSLRPLLDAVEVYERVEFPLHLDIATAGLRLVLELTVNNCWREELRHECMMRLQELQALPADVRTIAIALRDRCAVPVEVPTDDGDMVAVDDFEDDDHEREFEVPAEEYAALREQLDRLIAVQPLPFR